MGIGLSGRFPHTIPVGLFSHRSYQLIHVINLTDEIYLINNMIYIYESTNDRPPAHHARTDFEACRGGVPLKMIGQGNGEVDDNTSSAYVRECVHVVVVCMCSRACMALG